MATFVLVHGAWHGGWCWSKLMPLLRAAGHVVEAPDLPAHGADPAPAAGVGLDAYCDRVCEVIDSLEGDVVLVGHSLGGVTITQVAARRSDRLQSLVYLAAFLPDPEAIFAPDEAMTSPELVAAVGPSEDGTTLLFAPKDLRYLFYEDCSDEDVAFARERLCPEPAGLVSGAVQVAGDRSGRVPRDYIVCLRDRALLPSGQRALIERHGCRNVYQMDTSHSPFFSAPEELARILGEIATS
jgi:pimeloyl-ACP methyl ester carboxylesterase